jgi:hypothetical protein
MGLCSTAARIGAMAAPVIAGRRRLLYVVFPCSACPDFLKFFPTLVLGLDSVYAPLPFLIMGGTSIGRLPYPNKMLRIAELLFLQ